MVIFNSYVSHYQRVVPYFEFIDAQNVTLLVNFSLTCPGNMSTCRRADMIRSEWWSNTGVGNCPILGILDITL